MRLFSTAILFAALVARVLKKSTPQTPKSIATHRTYSETRADFERYEFDGYNEIGAMG